MAQKTNSKFILATPSNVTLVNQTDVEYSVRQMASSAYFTPDGNEILVGECNAEFPKLYTDEITAQWMVEEGYIDEWPYGPTFKCCKCDADIVVAIPPEFPGELCTICSQEVETEWIPGVGEVTTIVPCKQHTNTPCSSAYDLKLSVILGILFLEIVSEL